MDPFTRERDAGIPSCKSFKIKSVCVIGAGPSGMAAAKYLLAEEAFSEIKIFEQRAEVGGLWNHCPAFENGPDRHIVPQTDAHAGHDKPIWDQTTSIDGLEVNGICKPSFMSPVYDTLETNIPRGLMGFSDLDWPAGSQLFPRHETVLHYLNEYSRDIAHLIEFQTQVLDVRMNDDGRWSVKTHRIARDVPSKCHESTFDAVVVASGHFDVPLIPEVAGIEEWNHTYPGSILHSKFYRHPKDFAGKKVIVVGNSASGVDIASQVATACKLPIIQSQKSESFLQPDKSSSKLEKPEITKYVPEGRKVQFADGSVEADVDIVIYCTGYFYSFPFHESLDPPVVTKGEYVENLYQHIFYRPQPTLSFVTLNQKIIPFPIAEAQSAVIARVLSGRLDLPSATEMEQWENDTLRETGGGRSFHVLKFPMDADYLNMLHDWAMSVDHAHKHHKFRRRSLSATESTYMQHTGHGKEPPYWGEKEYWCRERFPAIKKAFQKFGEERKSKRSLEDVGFDFAEWKKEKIEEARTLL